MNRLILLLAPLALVGCGFNAGTVASAGAAAADTVGVPPPVTYADRTTLDEKGATGAELMFTFAAKGAALAIRTGTVSEPTTIVKIGEGRAKLYGLLLKVRAAYRTGNAASYSAAYREFEGAIASFNTLF